MSAVFHVDTSDNNNTTCSVSLHSSRRQHEDFCHAEHRALRNAIMYDYSNGTVEIITSRGSIHENSTADSNVLCTDSLCGMHSGVLSEFPRDFLDEREYRGDPGTHCGYIYPVQK